MAVMTLEMLQDFANKFAAKITDLFAKKTDIPTNMKGASSSAAGAAGLAPAPAKGAQGKFLRGDGTWQTPPDTTYSAMTGATADAAGKAGLVPAPAAGKQAKFLRGDGTWDTPTNTTYTNAGLGQGYGTCATAAATVAKVATLSSYALVTGGIVAIKFTYAVPASATLNINSKGAKAIYYKGAAITAGVINAGDIGLFIYNGSQYLLLAVDAAVGELEEATTDDIDAIIAGTFTS